MHDEPSFAVLAERAVLAIVAANKALSDAPTRKTQRRTVSHMTTPACFYCSAPIDLKAKWSKAADLLVPHAHGGKPRTENLVLACYACSASKGGMDLLSWSKLDTLPHPDALKARRLIALESATNHLTGQRAMVPKAKLLEALHARWILPRVRAYAVHSQGRSFIGWKSFRGSRGAPADYGLVRHLATSVQGSRLETEERATLYSVPSDAFFDLVWQLIDANALVCELDIGAPAANPDPDDWRTCWSLHFDSLDDLRRRRPWGGKAVAPRKPRVLATAPHAVADRIRKRLQVCPARLAKLALEQAHANAAMRRMHADWISGRVDYEVCERLAVCRRAAEAARVYLDEVRQFETEFQKVKFPDEARPIFDLER